MELVIVLIAVAVLGLGALVAAGRFGSQQPEPVRDIYQPPVEHRMTAEDLAGARFDITPMGYDMAEVDEWMARMARELDRRDGLAGEAAPAADSGVPQETGPGADSGVPQETAPAADSGVPQETGPAAESRVPQEPKPAPGTPPRQAPKGAGSAPDDSAWAPG